jgi:secreted trypsin-like serine protease
MNRTRLAIVGALLSAFAPVGVGAAATPAHTPRITPGTDETIAPRPWPAQGFLHYQENPGDPKAFTTDCGGSLVSGRWFLTAGHCVTNSQDGTVRGGTFTLTLGAPNLTQATAANRFPMGPPLRHPRYDRCLDRACTITGLPRNDIALLRVSGATPPSQEPLSIAPPGEPSLTAPATKAVVLGWGITCATCKGSDLLRQVAVPIVSDAACAATYPGAADTRAFDATVMVCAGQNDRGACEGDSGGPLMVPRLGELVIVGVVSGSPIGRRCTEPGYPGVFARVTAPDLNDWVRSQIPTAAIAVLTSAPRAASSIALAAAATRPPNQLVAPVFAWDLDNDGAFDDAIGPSARQRWSSPGVYAVRAQAAYPSDGDRAIARQIVVVGPRAPRLVDLPRRLRIGTLRARRRAVLRVRCATACVGSATLRSGDTTIGRGQASASRAATIALTIKLSQAGLRRLRAARRGQRLALRVTVTDTVGRTTLKRNVELR